jgi:GT2 family glycosyltransferase
MGKVKVIRGKWKDWKELHLVVLTHNAVSVTKTFLAKLYAYTDPSLFCLTLIDNGSTDNTVDVLRKFFGEKDNISLILNDDNEGVIGGRNQGFDLFLEEGESKYLMNLDNDQFVKKGWYEQHRAVLESGYDLVGVEAWQMSDALLPSRRCQMLREHFTYVGCGGSLMRRAIPETIGKFDEQFNPSWFEDPDYCIRANDAGLKIGWNICARIDHLAHQTLGNIERKREIFTRSYKRFNEKWKRHRLPRLKQRYLDAFDCVQK